MDGNFKAEHLHPTHPEDEVWLTDVQCFMVSKDQYKAHLAIANNIIQPSECNNHRAINQANASPHTLEGTRIGSCGFSKGQTYNKHFWCRVNESLYLSLPFGMEIIPGIGLWHVHGHQDKCYVWYTSTFITGAARIDREIMEMFFLCQKYKEAIKGVTESASAFDKLNETADPIMVAK
ncbi:uncharacterized protein HD556DRAFT_1312463 [Suillus plorans]|uniref:Uncharacterized protein n=1 Tax=Suillus plorans TaxID=116603 RepID=A0A9P7AFQ5_9AGAM|nr:uncharacterized protein HD556DRAFT_1312463 [Suillus plorans]KAG1787885.1 hypothetical protein HD556DRAFT_1312463 [Suillus plorans]